VPLIGPSAAAGGVEFENRCGALGRADRRVRHQLAEPNSKTLLLCVVEMPLVAEEDDIVLEQNLIDRANRLLRQISGKSDIPDLRTDAGGALDDVSARDDVVDGGRLSHDRVPFAIAARQSSAVRRSLQSDSGYEPG